MKQVRAWLIMIPDDVTPTSEVAYKQHIDLIDVALPSNAGTLQADGTWTQTSGAASAFARELPDLARKHGQQYVPVLNSGHGVGNVNLLQVLDDSAAQRNAARDLVRLATTRWDTPWDGVMYDSINVPDGYLNKHEVFIRSLSDAVRAAGVPFEYAQKGYMEGERDDMPSLSFVAEIADAFDCYCYGYRNEPYPVNPLWWQERCVQHALDGGVLVRKLNLGFGLYSRYWLDGAPSPVVDMTSHSEAMQMVEENSWRIKWVEKWDGQYISEKYTDTDIGKLWILDGDSVRPRLDLIDRYGLNGAMPFVSGMGDESAWKTIAKWKQHGMLGKMSGQKLHGRNGVFGSY